MARATGTRPIGNGTLLQFFIVLAIGTALLQFYIARVASNEITLGTYLLLAAIGVYYFYFRMTHATQLRQRPYGDYLVHVGGYIVINGSFWIHATLLAFRGNQERINSSWFGLLFGMSVLWGIGVLIHTLGAVRGKGYDDVHV